MTSPAIRAKAERPVRRKENEPIPDGEGTLLERASHWLLVEDEQRSLNEWCGGIPQLLGPVEQYRMARAVYGARQAPYDVVRKAQGDLTQAARAWVETTDSEEPRLVAILQRLDRALTEYRRIGGTLDREPSEGAPG